MPFQQCNFWVLFVKEQTENYKTNINKSSQFQISEPLNKVKVQHIAMNKITLPLAL